jgi:hypothetical protein
VFLISIAVASWRALNVRGRFLLLVGLALIACGVLSCAPLPRSLPPGLASWATAKAARLTSCLEAGQRGQDLFRCLGDYAPDRGTWACERAAKEIAEQRSAP